MATEAPGMLDEAGAPASGEVAMDAQGNPPALQGNEVQDQQDSFETPKEGDEKDNEANEAAKTDEKRDFLVQLTLDTRTLKKMSEDESKQDESLAKALKTGSASFFLEEGKQRIEAFVRVAAVMKKSACARGLFELEAKLEPILEEWVQQVDDSSLLFIIIAGHGSQSGQLSFTSLGAKEELTPGIFWGGIEVPEGGQSPYKGLASILRNAGVGQQKLANIRVIVTTCYSDGIAEKFVCALPQELEGIQVTGIGTGKTTRKWAGGSTVLTHRKQDDTETYLLNSYQLDVEAAVKELTSSSASDDPHGEEGL